MVLPMFSLFPAFRLRPINSIYWISSRDLRFANVNCKAGSHLSNAWNFKKNQPVFIKHFFNAGKQFAFDAFLTTMRIPHRLLPMLVIPRLSTFAIGAANRTLYRASLSLSRLQPFKNKFPNQLITWMFRHFICFSFVNNATIIQTITWTFMWAGHGIWLDCWRAVSHADYRMLWVAIANKTIRNRHPILVARQAVWILSSG